MKLSTTAWLLFSILKIAEQQVIQTTKAAASTAAWNISALLSPLSLAIDQIDGLAAEVEAAVIQAQSSDLTNPLGLFINSELPYYGLSPPSYPSPSVNNSQDEAFVKARALVSQMSVQEKAAVTLGQLSTHGCSGFSGSVENSGFPGLCLQDAESGIRAGKDVSGYPAQLHIGASWNRTLARERASTLGKEFRANGIDVLLGPVAGPLGRIAEGGRNWEGFSNDPYLAGSLLAPTVSGIQESLIACVKHAIANEQETYRTPFLQGRIAGLGQQAVSSNLDDKPMHELYLWPFYDALRAGAGSVMCSYNRVNSSHACQNGKVMNGLLKTELGFEGFVVSDWFATHTGIAAVNAGLDMVMPQSLHLTLSIIETAVQNGSVLESRLDDQAVRILAAWYRFSKSRGNAMNETTLLDAKTISFQSAVEGHVLVKNVNATLPLTKTKALSLFGYDAVGGLNTSVKGPILYDVGLSNTQHYPDGRLFTALDAGALSLELDPTRAGPGIAMDGTLIGGGGSGAITPNYTISPYDAFLQQAKLDGTALYTVFSSPNPTVKSSQGPCIVFINAQAAETWDRLELADEYSDQLVLHVASQCSPTIVVIHNAGPRLVDSFIDHPNITAVVFAHLPGQESGRALVELMYGRQSFSGRLPYTVAKRESDYGALLGPTVVDKSVKYPQSNFSEGALIDYKHFIANDITPRFRFGYGLTYSNFSYSDFHVNLNTSADMGVLPPDHGMSPIPQGGLGSLYDILATVTCTITNTGSVEAAEVAQLYVGIPGSPAAKVLRGFDKHLIQPGKSTDYSFPLRRRDLSSWDVMQQQWVLNRGSYGVMVGKDVLDIQLEGELKID